jgi:hypothetical protein
MAMHSGHDTSHSYNALLPIALASRALAARGGDAVVGELLNVISEAGFGGSVGIRLLHNHNEIEDGEIMLEQAVIDQDGYALVTSAERSELHRDCMSNSWQWNGEKFVPVEYSVRDLVSDVDPDRLQSLFAALADKIEELQVQDLLGPCANYSDQVKLHSIGADSAFLEMTFEEERRNVIRYVSRNDVAFTNSAKTKWHAERVMDDSGNLVWMTACNCYCYVYPEGGHSGSTTHR